MWGVFTVKLTKPWTPEIFMECYCVARSKPIRRVITKLQTATVISLWFWGLLACPELYCDWPVHNQHSRNFRGVHGFLSLTVTRTFSSENLHFQYHDALSIIIKIQVVIKLVTIIIVHNFYLQVLRHKRSV